MPAIVKKGSFYLFVAIIVFYAVFPFYYAIITSFKTGTAIFDITYWPTSFGLDNYFSVLKSGGRALTWDDVFHFNISGFPLNFLKRSCQGKKD